MFFKSTSSRRSAIKVGFASLAAAAATIPKTYAALRPKAKGETKVVYLGGDHLHNGFGQEYYLRKTLRDANWRLLFTHDARYVTPDFLSDTDLLIITRWLGPIPGWVPGPIIEERNETDGFMSDELEEAIIDNVRNRGMGFIALHATVTCADKPKLGELMGIESVMHGAFQQVRLYDLNKDHPITTNIKNWRNVEGRGDKWWLRELTDETITEFELSTDENFGAKIVNKNVVTLFKSEGLKDKRIDIGGWCIEQGKGRIVGLHAGHLSNQFFHPINRQLHWRAAHWAMKRDIPPYTGALYLR